MADAAVSYAIQKIGDAIINEALFIGSSKQQAEELKEELTWMKSFLQDADAKARDGNQLVQNWVKLVREAAQDTEDLIESFAIPVYAPGLGRCGDFFSKLMPCARAVIRRHYFGLEIEGLKQRIKNIGESADRYKITALSDDRRERGEVNPTIAPWMARSVEASNSSHVVLRDADKKAILELLDAKREGLSVVSIFGTGGLGKTTLAQKVFNDPQIKIRFRNRFWIGVSQDWKIDKLLKDLLRKISTGESQENETMDMLEMRLRNSLLGKKYLIVMDDVWDVAVWRMFGNCLPDENNGSKVVITTRSRTVARAADPGQAYELRFLDKEESWELFISKAIPREEDRRECEGRLKELGEQMAERCGGLPLALVVMGSLLSQKGRSTEEWERVSHVWRDNDEEGTVVMRILALSYADLPYDLKWCFLYLSAFPEDYLIESERLIGQWIAEGFITERGDGLTLEETAEIQLEKLIKRSLVQVVRREHFDGIILCRVHDLLRELCISEAKEIDFMSVCRGRSPLPAESLRRISVITEPEETISRLKSAPRLRALLGFNFKYRFGSDFVMNLSVGWPRLIRVIDLQGAGKLKVLPKEIGGLVNLRYLGLEGTRIESLPGTIKNLSRLQVLAVGDTNIEEMTGAVWEIETLRQVVFPQLALAPNRVQCRWRSLQVLRWARAGNWMDDTLPKVKDIKILDLRGIDASHHKVLFLNLRQFSRLKILSLYGSSIPWTAVTLSGLHLLRTLVLIGPVNATIPEDSLLSSRGFYCPELYYQWPASLTYLELYGSHLPQDPLPSLARLSELRFLSLWGRVYRGAEEMKFRGDEFKQLQKLKLYSNTAPRRIIVEDGAMPHLQKLRLYDLTNLEKMTVEDGAMPRLQNLKISYCPRLKTIPPRLDDIAEWTWYIGVGTSSFSSF